MRGGDALSVASDLVAELKKQILDLTTRYADLHARYRDVLAKAFPVTVKMVVQGTPYEDQYRQVTFYRAVIKPETHVFHATLQYVQDLPEDAVRELIEDAVKRVSDDVRQQFAREIGAARQGLLAWKQR